MNTKILISGLALAGAAVLAVNGGTFAAFTDTEVTPAQSVASGTLDINFDDADLSNSAIAFPLNVSNQQPGATNPTQQIHVRNTGSLPVSVAAKIRKTVDSDDGCSDAEEIAEGGDGNAPLDGCGSSGELDSAMTLSIDGYAGVGPVLAGLAVGDAPVLVRDMAGTVHDSIFTLAADPDGAGPLLGGDKWLSVDYEIPLSAGNAIQSDTVKFEVVFEGAQL